MKLKTLLSIILNEAPTIFTGQYPGRQNPSSLGAAAQLLLKDKLYKNSIEAAKKLSVSGEAARMQPGDVVKDSLPPGSEFKPGSYIVTHVFKDWDDYKKNGKSVIKKYMGRGTGERARANHADTIEYWEFQMIDEMQRDYRLKKYWDDDSFQLKGMDKDTFNASVSDKEQAQSYSNPLYAEKQQLHPELIKALAVKLNSPWYAVFEANLKNSIWDDDAGYFTFSGNIILPQYQLQLSKRGGAIKKLDILKDKGYI